MRPWEAAVINWDLRAAHLRQHLATPLGDLRTALAPPWGIA